MKKSINYFLAIINIFVLLVYSSEISFMPNYDAKPDKLYLLIPILLFSISFIIMLIVNIVFLVKAKIPLTCFVSLILSIIFFMFLNNPKCSSQIFGFFGVFLINVALFFMIRNDKELD